MNVARRPLSVWVAVLIGTAVHLDWHLARGHHHQAPSFELPYHWIIAVPVFAWTAWYIARRWPADVLVASALTILAGLFLGQGAEPLFEMAFLGGTTMSSFNAERLLAFAEFAGVGLVTYGATLALLRVRRSA